MADENLPEEDVRQREDGDQEASEQSSPAKKPSPLPGIILVLVLTVVSAGSAMVAANMVGRPAQAEPGTGEAAEAAAPAEPVEVKEEQDGNQRIKFTLEEPLLVNVYRTRHRRYLSVKPVFELDNAKTRKLLEDKKEELQHMLLTILKAKTLEELDAPEAVNSVAREIQETTNLGLDLNNGIRKVYFTQFVVQ